MTARLQKRKGTAATQWAIIAAVTVLGLVGTYVLLGNRTNNKLNQTAEDMADPTKLTKRFGS